MSRTTDDASRPAAAISCRGLEAGYGQVPVLRGLDIRVDPGQVVALLGANGAGKSTTLLALAGVVPAKAGVVELGGVPTRAPLHRRARQGLRLVTEDRAVLMSLTVFDNLRLAHKDLDEPLRLFPELEPLLSRKVGLLSGGEQQMLTLARALVNSTVLLADELSLGLAPKIVQRLLASVRESADRGLAVLLVEQQMRNAMEVADYVYVLQRGRIAIEGTSEELRLRTDEVRAAYLPPGPEATRA